MNPVRDSNGNVVVKVGDKLSVQTIGEAAHGKPRQTGTVEEMDGNVAYVRLSDGSRRAVEL